MDRSLRTTLSAALAVLSTVSLPAQSREDVRRILLINSLVPGTAQLALGQRTEGIIYLSSLPLTLVGTGLLVYHTLELAPPVELGVFNEEGRTYFLRPQEIPGGSGSQWLYYSGITLVLYGNLLSAYSQYAAARDLTDRVPALAASAKRTGRESLPALLAAPFTPRHVLTHDVLAILALTTASSLAGSDPARILEFFRRDTVPFMGSEVSPGTGLLLRLATSLVLVTANAAGEEILFRGLTLEQSGPVVSSLTFGLAHLPNALLPGVPIEDTVLQTLFALGFGFYAAGRTVEAGYRFERMVALHFWNNILAFTLGYLLDPEGQQNLSIGYRAAW